MSKLTAAAAVSAFSTALAAATFGLAAAVAGSLYDMALADCRAAAAKSEDPTDYKCDWRSIATKPSSDLSGKYTYEAEGLSGELTILESPGGDAPALIGVLTVSSDSNAHTCSAAIEAKRDGDALVAKPEEAEDCELSIAGDTEPGTLKVTANEACRNYYCGMRAAFDGTWKTQK